MIKKDILDLISNFDEETWKYDTNSKLDNDMEYIYAMEREIQKMDDSNIKMAYDKLVALMGIIRFKYGFESIVINNSEELKDLKIIIDDILLDSSDIINQYNYVSTMYNNFTSKTKNIDFIENKFENVDGKEGLYLASLSLKSLISNNNYRQLLDNNQINEIIIDYIKLNKGIGNIKKSESKYQEVINEIWKQSMSNEIKDNKNFSFLFSNIVGNNLREQANLLINRPVQSSCSLVSSDFIATYGTNTRRIGFIYPNNSKIIMASAYDLASNVFDEGVANKEKGTSCATPEAILNIGKERTIKKGEDLLFSSCYNEILVNAKPCGIAVIGLGENDLNIDYQDLKTLSLDMNLPIYNIDTMKYKNELSENDKYYITFHSILSYLGISNNELAVIQNDNSYNKIEELINYYKDQIAEAFIKLKDEDKLNKENMCEIINNIIDTSKLTEESNIVHNSRI